MNRTMWTEEEMDLLKTSYATIPKEEMMSGLPSKSWDGIRKKAKRLGLKGFKSPRIAHNKGIRFLTDNSKKILNNIKRYKDMYDSGKSIKYIASITYTCHATISKIFNEANISRKDRSNAHRKYRLDEYFFDKIDTEEKAYFLGFVYADGFVYLKKNFMMGIEIHQEDVEILKSFKKAISSGSPISKHKYKDRDSVKIRLYSKHMTDQLVSKGCIENKSLVLRFPDENIVPNILLHHFIRGYFDGDGCIKRSSKRHSSVQIDITSSNYFIDACVKKLHEHAGMNIVKSYPRKNHKYSSLTYCGKGNALRMYTFLYKDATVFLKRKHDRFLEYLSIPQN